MSAFPGVLTRRGGSRWLSILLLAMIGTGVFFRFAGLGGFGVAADEFHTAAAVSYILEHGVPRFPCGGYYVRGLLYHYVLAGVSLVSSLPDETLWRWTSALLSLPALLFAYLLGRRLASPVAGLACAAILSLSVWEIETARYLRMYGPFASAFLAYVYCFVACIEHYTWRRFLACIFVSFVALFIHEGGAMLVALDVLLLFSMPAGHRIRAGLTAFALLTVAGIYMSQDCAVSGAVRLPDNWDSANLPAGRPRIGPLELPTDLFLWLDRGGVWIALFCILVVSSALWIARSPRDAATADRLLIRASTVALLALHQFFLLAVVPILTWTLGWFRLRSWFSLTGRRGGLLILLWTAFWAALLITDSRFF